jgi:hypothetical protein
MSQKSDWKLSDVSTIAIAIIFVIPAMIVADGGAGTAAFTSSLNSSVGNIYSYVKIALNICLFVYCIWPLYNALVGQGGGDKSHHWWQIIGIAIFLILLNTLPTIYKAIFGATDVNIQ